MEHSRRLLNSPQVVRLSDVTVSVANADREYGANLFYRFNASDCIRGCVRGAIPQPTNGSRIAEQIDAAMDHGCRRFTFTRTRGDLSESLPGYEIIGSGAGAERDKVRRFCRWFDLPVSLRFIG
jgi:hypothetical protein